ncbi:MAG: hypothetical protein M5U09_26825 [Gammaproteobacteria bacterium]|nr:hypothetical protein [Gammaproteobacteria bacterium]
MNGLLDALGQLAREKDIPYERLLEQFQKALAAGYRKHVGTEQERSPSRWTTVRRWVSGSTPRRPRSSG